MSNEKTTNEMVDETTEIKKENTEKVYPHNVPNYEEIMNSPKIPEKGDFDDETFAMIWRDWTKLHPYYSDVKKEQVFVDELEPERVETVQQNYVDEDEEEESAATGLGLFKWIVLSLLVLALCLFGFMFWRNHQTKQREASYENLKQQLVVELDESMGAPTIEAGEELAYSDTNVESLREIPDQLRPMFKSVPDGAKITLSGLDTTAFGEQEVKINISKTDKYGQEVTNAQTFIINIEDTKEPEITLNASSIEIEAGDSRAIKDNIKSVIDPVFGEYIYSTNKENQTYWIDATDVNYSELGTYPVRVIVYDNGNEIVQEFDVKVTNVIKNEEQSATANQTTTQANTNNNAGAATQNQAPRVVYSYVDQFGNIYTEEQVQQMKNNNEDMTIENMDDFMQRNGINHSGTYSADEAKCYSTWGKWNGSYCIWD